jgi:SAM-dependent methyltransferase
MSANFAQYSAFYNLFYKDKDYAGESRYIRELLAEYAGEATRSILELGCGTGTHAALLSNMGFDVLGVDLSEAMLEEANTRAAQTGLSATRLEFVHGDVRTFRAGRTFDAALALFHVLSYQTSDHDVCSTLATAAAHLPAGGLFIFDFWYGPSVLWLRPGVRVKRFSGSGMEVTRTANPVLHDQTNVVDVNYSVLVQADGELRAEEIRETHRMRYFFLPELAQFLRKTSFELLHAEEWITRRPPSVDTWGVCVVARKSVK